MSYLNEQTNNASTVTVVEEPIDPTVSFFMSFQLFTDIRKSISFTLTLVVYN